MSKNSRTMLNDISIEFLRIFYPKEMQRRTNINSKFYHHTRLDEKKNELNILPSVSKSVRQALIFQEIKKYVPEDAARYQPSRKKGTNAVCEQIGY